MALKSQSCGMEMPARSRRIRGIDFFFMFAVLFWFIDVLRIVRYLFDSWLRVCW